MLNCLKIWSIFGSSAYGIEPGAWDSSQGLGYIDGHYM